MTETEIKNVHEEIVAWIHRWFADKGNAPAVIGISGGKDSAVCAALLVEALGAERVVGVQLPCGNQSDISDSDAVFEFLGIRKRTVNILPALVDLTSEILKAVDKPIKYISDNVELPALYSTNTPARIRMVTLYGIAAMVGGFVCNTCNLSEDWVGYSTKWGDAVGDFSLLNRLTKTEVCQLGDELGLPKNLVHKAPSDGMSGMSDEDKLGFTYEQLDNIIHTKERMVIDSVTINKVAKMHNNPNTKKKCVELDSPLYWLPTAF